MVSKASDDLPEPDRPVRTISLLRGSTRSMCLRLCSAAPLMTMESTDIRDCEPFPRESRRVMKSDLKGSAPRVSTRGGACAAAALLILQDGCPGSVTAGRGRPRRGDFEPRHA